MAMFRKLGATLWKCCRVRRHHYIQTAVVIVLPILMFALIGYVRSHLGMGKTEVNETNYTRMYSEYEFINSYPINSGTTRLLYAPNSTVFVRKLMERVKEHFGMFDTGVYIFFKLSERRLSLCLKQI